MTRGWKRVRRAWRAFDQWVCGQIGGHSFSLTGGRPGEPNAWIWREICPYCGKVKETEVEYPHNGPPPKRADFYQAKEERRG